ncbi:MAG: hypothetical protein IPF64_10660 [Flavobacteriales bacterium]|nr:hypothetical protein [Flavobacteriales bacterium]
MRGLMICSTLSILVGCSEPLAPRAPVESVQVFSDSVEAPQYLQASEVAKSRSTLDSLIKDVDKQRLLDVFQFSNSGGSRKSYLAVPDTPGFQYSYFVFWGKEEPLREYVDGVIVTTYKFGKVVGRYNENEVLIEIKANLQDERLGGLNLVGKDLALLLRGSEPVFEQDGVVVIQSGQHTLVLHHDQAKRIDWFKYALVLTPLSDLGPSELRQLTSCD